MNSRFYSSIAAVTNLQVTANPGDTSIQVASSSGWPGSFPYIVSLDYGSATEELVLVTSGGPSNFTVTRAYDGTSASTHNAGAVVRHTSSAIDFTDSRTHEASSTGVHGISGQFVDTTSVQTLTNKTLTAPIINNPTIGGTASGGTFTGATLTSPTINTPTITNPTVTGGGSLAGTITGSPTFSGTVTFSGSLISTGIIQSTGAAASDVKHNFLVSGDTVPQRTDKADGTISWGPGGVGVQDVTLQRSGVGFLSLTGSFTTSGSVTATGNVLGNDISLATTVWATFTPSWAGLGTGTLGTNVGWYKKVGKIVFFEVYSVWSANGSGSTGVSVDFPTTPFRDGNGSHTTRQAVTSYITGSNGGVIDGLGVMYAFASDSGATGATLRRFDGIQCQGSNFITGSITTIQGWYREA
jgi:hypothetical protein